MYPASVLILARGHNGRKDISLVFQALFEDQYFPKSADTL